MKNTSSKTILLRIIIQAAIMLIAGGLLYFFSTHYIVAIILAATGVLVLVTGIFLRPVSGVVIRFQHIVMKFTGIIVTWLLLVPFYFLWFVPARLVQLLRNKDPLERSFPGTGESYWTPYSGSFDKDNFRRQY
ncbi:MAG: hypothetical protein JW881_11030 [Spirochaetales bacterium]|nr:hypothetical protein [Spirochaetales bacterium]